MFLLNILLINSTLFCIKNALGKAKSYICIKEEKNMTENPDSTQNYGASNIPGSRGP